MHITCNAGSCFLEAQSVLIAVAEREARILIVLHGDLRLYVCTLTQLVQIYFLWVWHFHLHYESVVESPGAAIRVAMCVATQKIVVAKNSAGGYSMAGRADSAAGE